MYDQLYYVFGSLFVVGLVGYCLLAAKVGSQHRK